MLRVSDWIPQIIKIVSKLIGKNHAYVSEHGNVFFDVESFPGNGKFDPHQLSCQQNMPTQLERSRKFHPEKKNRNDFALWKRKINGKFPADFSLFRTVALRIFAQVNNLSGGS